MHFKVVNIGLGFIYVDVDHILLLEMFYTFYHVFFFFNAKSKSTKMMHVISPSRTIILKRFNYM